VDTVPLKGRYYFLENIVLGNLYQCAGVAFELCQTHFEVSKCQFKLNLKMDPELYSTRSGG
jgi:hypothetical protein